MLILGTVITSQKTIKEDGGKITISHHPHYQSVIQRISSFFASILILVENLVSEESILIFNHLHYS